jgi:hypothetical protein
MTDAPINFLHDFLWMLFDTLKSLFDIAPYIAVFTILSLVFTGLALAVHQQHQEQARTQDEHGEEHGEEHK